MTMFSPHIPHSLRHISTWKEEEGTNSPFHVEGIDMVNDSGASNWKREEGTNRHFPQIV